MKKLIISFVVCVCSVAAFSQNITNTLGTGGQFTINNGGYTFFMIDQATGYLTLNSGVILKGEYSFLHDYQAPGTVGNNTFLGINAGNFSMNGSFDESSNNTGVGFTSLSSLTTGYYNSAFGDYSLGLNTTGIRNSAIGHQSLYNNTTGSHNTAVGNISLNSNTEGSNNSAFGSESLISNTTGNNNTGIGFQSLFANTTGVYNTAIGDGSLSSNIIGVSNTAVGVQSLKNNTVGNGITTVGVLSGSIITAGVNLICLGYDSQPTSGNATNQITLGNVDINSLRCNVQSITSLSDARDKKNIKDLDLGIDFLMKIKPRLYNWDKREWYTDNKSDGSKMKKEPTAGFIAQELDSVQTSERAGWLNLVLKDNPEKWEATPGNLLPIIVKAIQDLNLKCEYLKTENAMLKKENENLSSEVGSLKSISEKLVKLELEINELKDAKYTSLNETK